MEDWVSCFVETCMLNIEYKCTCKPDGINPNEPMNCKRYEEAPNERKRHGTKERGPKV